MGRLLAFYLVNAGFKVSIFEQGSAHVENNCSMAAAGLLTPFSELARSDSLTAAMSAEALNIHWPSILTTINKNILLKKNGTLVLSHPENKAELEILAQRHYAFNLEFHCRKLLADEINQLEPELSKFDSAYYMSQEGYLDNQDLMQCLRSYLLAKKVNWYDNTWVKDIYPHWIATPTKTYQFDLACDCRGLGAKNVFTDLRGVRGELIWVHAPEVNISRVIRLLSPRYSLYIAPRPNQNYLLGASEIESENYSQISVRTALELLSGAYYLHSGFSEASIIQTVQHCRPTLNNGKPRIQFAQGWIAINGLYRHGFSLAPVIAGEVLVWLQSGFSSLKYSTLWSPLK